MAIPQNVKKQAMDAVAHKETTDWIRHYSNDNAPKPLFSQPPREASATKGIGTLSEDAKKQAMDAVSHAETKAQIRLVSVSEIDAPLHSPTRDGLKASQQIAQMHRAGQDADRVHRTATKDGFAREG
jgi:hypothetical protein